MKFALKIAHLIFPRESNNQKAKLLHSSTLSLLTLFLVFYQLILNFLPRIHPDILGFAANISPAEVIRLTNEKRSQAGIPSLNENSILSQAALAKGADMINRGYWAHIAPDGIQPWKFFTDAGYKYRFAGENLARDFSNPSSAIDAWMASDSHRENLLSPKYKEIGVAVIDGNLAGVDTTIIVQFFGTKYVDTVPSVPVAEAKAVSTSKPGTTTIPKSIAQEKPQEVVVTTNVSPSPLAFTSAQEGLTGVKRQFSISPFSITKSISLLIVTVLLLVLVIDGIEVSRRKIARIGGRTFAHITFLGMILIIALILKAGQII